MTDQSLVYSSDCKLKLAQENIFIIDAKEESKEAKEMIDKFQEEYGGCQKGSKYLIGHDFAFCAGSKTIYTLAYDWYIGLEEPREPLLKCMDKYIARNASTTGFFGRHQSCSVLNKGFDAGEWYRILRELVPGYSRCTDSSVVPKPTESKKGWAEMEQMGQIL